MKTIGRLAAVTGGLCLALGAGVAQAGSETVSTQTSSVAPIPLEGKGLPDTSILTDPRQQALTDADPLIARVTASYSDVAGGASWDMDSQTLTVNVVGQPETVGSRAQQYIEAFEGALREARNPLTLRFKEVKYSRKLLEDTANVLSSKGSLWAEGLQGFKVASWNPGDEKVTVTVATAEVSNWKKRLESAPLPVPVDVLAGDGDFFRAQTRFADSTPFLGGMHLHAAYQGGNVVEPNACTAGFTWTRWSGLGDAASTANHCVNPGSANPAITNTYVNWKNGSLSAGSAVLTSPASDTALLQGRTYSAGVFVGSQDTTTWRWVDSVGTQYPTGQVIALSGAFSGLHSASVSTIYSHPTINTLIGMSNEQALEGDSGGPWLTTDSGTGRVKAWGQHHGQCRASTSAPWRDCFVPISRISAMTSASVKTWP